MEKFTCIFFWLCAFLLIIGSLLTVFSKQKKIICICLEVIFLALAGLFILLKSPFSVVVQFIFAVFAFGVASLLMNSYVKKDQNLGVEITPRLFLGGLTLILMLIALLWANISNYLAGILDMLSGDTDFSEFHFDFVGFYHNMQAYLLDVSVCILVLLAIGLVGVFNILKHKEGLK